MVDPIDLPLDFKYGGGRERTEAVTVRSYDPWVYARCDAFAVAGCAGGRPLSEQTRAGEVEGVELRQRMARLIGGYQLSAAIGAVARLGVADALAAGPMGPQDLAARVGADAHSLGRILRALEDTGLFRKLDDGRIALTALGELLRSDAPMSARRGAIASTEEWRWRAYGHLTHSVRTGEPGFPLAHGCGLWEYLAREPDAAAMFNESMSRVAAANAAAIVRTYDFSHVNRLVDVGGGHGVLACAVLEANPHMHGVVFDLPGVIEGARTRVTEAGLTDRCELIAGDFFEAVPAGGDAYVLSWILHDWDDRSAARILANCRAGMRDGGRLLVIEMVIPSGEEAPASPDLDRLVKASDLEMLTIVGGRERTATEYRELHMNAGFELTRILALDSLPWSLIEGV